MIWSSEAMKAGLNMPKQDIGEMTEEELKEFRNQFDPDSMGFDGVEGVDEDGNETENN